MSDNSKPDDLIAAAGADSHRPPPDPAFSSLSMDWLLAAIRRRYAYGFSWLGRPIIQIPQDVYAISELIWRVKPDLIIETGVAHGGSLVLSASILALLDYCEAVESGGVLRPTESKRRVVGVDIDIRPHNRQALESHPLRNLLVLLEGSSTAPEISSRVHQIAEEHSVVLVMLDSNHTHEHVLRELELYAPMTTPNSYCVVWDTGVEDLPEGTVTDRPWGKGNNPKTAVREYLSRPNLVDRFGRPMAFEVDSDIEGRIALTAGPGGFLRRV